MQYFFICFKQESNELYMKNLQRIKISKKTIDKSLTILYNSVVKIDK